VGCQREADSQCSAVQRRVVLEYNKDPVSDDWQPVYAGCAISGNVGGIGPHSMQCARHPHHQRTVYSDVDVGSWTRITLRLPPAVFSRSSIN